MATAARRAPSAATGRTWSREVDVVVVGSGAAAFAAALTAASRGRSVVMLEKAAVHGGTTAKSGGVYWIPNNSFMRDRGLTDPRADALKYMARLSYPALYDPGSPTLGLGKLEYKLIGTFYDKGSGAIDALGTIGALQTEFNGPGLAGGANGDPDYGAELPEDKAPFGRHLRPKGGGGGAGLITQTKAAADKAGVDVLVGHRVERLIMNAGGQVVGVEAVADGKTLSFRARRGVIFGSGGFTHNRRLVSQFLRGPILGGCAVPTNTGDFVEIGGAVGAALGNMSNAFFAEIPFELAAQMASVPNDIWMPFGDSMIQVNRYGQRVVNEKAIYNERTQAHFYWDPSHREFPNLLLFMVYDSAVASSTSTWPFRWPVPQPGTEAPYVISGNTNNPTMFPLSSSGPYYAIITAGGTLDTKGGPRVNSKSQVLDTNGKRIPGLYGAGNCIASPAGAAYWSAGGTLGPALTFGYIAGRNAAAAVVKAV